MAEYSNNAVQTVNPGESVVFTLADVPCDRGFVGAQVLGHLTSAVGCLIGVPLAVAKRTTMPFILRILGQILQFLKARQLALYP